MSRTPKSDESEPGIEIFEGDISVLAAIEAGVRAVHEVLLDRDKPGEDTQEIERAAASRRVPVRRVTREVISGLAFGNTHGGVIARCGARTPSALIHTQIPDGASDWYAVLDGIEDPFNFGQAVRALYAAGCAGLALRPRTWRGGDGVIARSSAGASERIPVWRVEALTEAMTHFRNAGCRIAVTARDRRAESLYNAALTGPLCLMIGGEKRGLNRELLDAADVVLRIPYVRKFPHSLGSAGSTAVLAFELMRQRLR
jgi:23S rRNA (guanosine2251-2'-O)-methyltransferase